MPTNALEVIDALLASDARQAEIAHAITQDIPCIMEGKSLSPGQLRAYFEWVREGLLLASDLLGEETLPPQIFFTAEWQAYEGLFPGFGGYSVAFDAIVIHFVRVVLNAFVSGPDEMVNHDHCEIKGQLPARTNVMMMIMEECYHRYDTMILKCSLPDVPYTERDDPMEVRWRTYRNRLITEGVFSCRPTHYA